MHTTNEWLEYDTEWIPHLLKCSIIDSRNVLSWWTEPQNSPLWVQPHVWTSVSSSYAQYFHPPCTGTEQSRRGPASISMMRHPSYDSLGPRFVLHLDKKRQHCRRLCCRCWDSGDWGNVRVSPLLYSHCSRVLESSVVLRCLPSLARTLPVRRVFRKARSQPSSPLVTAG